MTPRQVPRGASAARPANSASAPSSCLDAQQPVPLGGALGARRRADLDLPGAPADREVGQPRVLGVARAGGDDRRVAGRPGALDGRLRAGQRAALVRLDEDRVRRRPLGSPRSSRSTCVTNRSSPSSWTLVPGGCVTSVQPAQSSSPSGSSSDTIGKSRHHASSSSTSSPASSVRSSAASRSRPGPCELGGGDVDGDRRLVARREAGALDARRAGARARRGSMPARARGRPRRRRATPAGPVAAASSSVALPHAPRPLDRLGEARRADRDDQEVLDVDARAARVRAARDDVDHRQRQQRLGPEPAPRGARPSRCRRGERGGERHGQHGVGAEPAEVGRAVERPKRRVERRPGRRRPARRRSARDRAVHGRDGAPDAAAAVALAAVAQLAGLVRCRSTRPTARSPTPLRAAREPDLAGDGRRAAGVERLPGDDAVRSSSSSPLQRSLERVATRSRSVAGGSVSRALAARRAPAAARSRSGTRPATCRRRGRASGSRRGRRAYCGSGASSPRQPRARRTQKTASAQPGSASASAGRWIAFSIRWLSMNAEVEGGVADVGDLEVDHPERASSPTRTFFGEKSPWTRHTRVVEHLLDVPRRSGLAELRPAAHRPSGGTGRPGAGRTPRCRRSAARARSRSVGRLPRARWRGARRAARRPPRRRRRRAGAPSSCATKSGARAIAMAQRSSSTASTAGDEPGTSRRRARAPRASVSARSRLASHSSARPAGAAAPA